MRWPNAGPMRQCAYSAPKKNKMSERELQEAVDFADNAPGPARRIDISQTSVTIRSKVRAERVLSVEAVTDVVDLILRPEPCGEQPLLRSTISMRFARKKAQCSTWRGLNGTKLAPTRMRHNAHRRRQLRNRRSEISKKPS